MPRSVRIQYPGAFYHVLCRGDRREAIFADERDREIFLTTLEGMCGRTGILVHSYVLMSNHYHFLLETPEPNLVSGMQWFQGTYTQRFNARHRLSGHLFQGRYKALPIEAEGSDYLRRVSQYIHLNPARAGLLEEAHPELLSYRWSSFPLFVQKSRLPAWLRRERVFAGAELPDEGAGSRRRYEKWMERRTREVLEVEEGSEQTAEWRALQRGWYLGSESFRDRLMDLAEGVAAGRKRASYGKEGLQRHDENRAAELLSAGLERLGLSAEALGGLKQSDPRKQALAWLIKTQTVVGDEWLSARLHMGHRSNISRAVSSFRNANDRNRGRLQKILHACTD
ncbi:MAG TPA: transposase [Chthoniobacterales bacterium]|jgi:REP element-mobilizing transposase RayT